MGGWVDADDVTESRCEARPGVVTIQWCSYSSNTEWHVVSIVTSSHSISSWQCELRWLCCKSLNVYFSSDCISLQLDIMVALSVYTEKKSSYFAHCASL